MKTYEYILFDADDTLFHFDSFAGLQLTFTKYGIEFTKEDYQEYQSLNKSLWLEYQNGMLTAKELQHQRFTLWSNRLKIATHELNSTFLKAMADICSPLDGATSLLNTLKGKKKLGIITNGFTELQQIRLERTGMRNYFDALIISEQVGVAKPHRDIFDYALQILGNPLRETVLMVGDTLESDILGGINAGIDTCWLNMHNKPSNENILPHYQVTSLRELEELLDQ